jgi:NAD-dependent dihydropyrimidine dehydrogenase PreA subunit
MDGNGPRSGRPKRMNVLLFSTDPVALDATASRLIGLDPGSVPTTRAGQEMGLGTFLRNDIRLLGDGFDGLRVSGFKVNRSSSLMDFKGRRVRHMLVPRPQIDPARCVRCGICVKKCPVTPAVVDWSSDDHSDPPVYDYDRCIRCYCCQESCPENAITLHTPLLGRAAGHLLR